MVSIRVALAVPLLSVWTVAAPLAQGFTPPPGGQAGMSPSQPTPPQFMPPPSPAMAPPPGSFGDGRSRPGFGQQQAQPQPGQPQRQNYADELTDFGVPAQATLQDNVGSPTPMTIPGAHVITTAEMRQAVGSDIVLIDVLAAPPHPSLPGALMLPGAGDGGSFDDELQQKLWTALSQATQKNPDRPIAFFCVGSRCWESYNAALRAVNMGFKTVLWYRGGLAAWQAAGLQMTSPGGASGGGGAAPPRPRPGFGANPG